MTGLLDLPVEIRWMIYEHLSDTLQEDHEESVKALYSRKIAFLGAIRLGFERPMPRALLQTCRRLREEATHYGFSQSALRIDVGLCFRVIPAHYSDRRLSPAWVLPGSDSSSLGTNFQCISQHPFVGHLRELQVSGMVTLQRGRSFSRYMSPQSVANLPDLVNSLPGLRRLVVFVRATTCDTQSAAAMPKAWFSYRRLASVPLLRVASETPAHRRLEMRFVVWHPAVDPDQVLDDFTSCLSQELANGRDVGLYYNTIEPKLLDSSYEDGLRFRNHHESMVQPGDLTPVAGCALKPGAVQFVEEF